MKIVLFFILLYLGFYFGYRLSRKNDWCYLFPVAWFWILMFVFIK